MANFEPFTPKKSDSLKEVAKKSHLELLRSTVDLMDRSLTWGDFDWLKRLESFRSDIKCNAESM